MTLVRDSLVAGRAIEIPGFLTLEPYVRKGKRYREVGTGKLRRPKASGFVRIIVSRKLRDNLKEAAWS